MRNNHTLTFDQTTYTINVGKTTNDIFINGYPTDWYTDYDLEKIDDGLIFRKGIRLKNRNDEDTTTFYLYLDTDTLRFHDVVYIIKIIIEESSRKKKNKR